MVKSETRRDPSLKIRARDDEHKNPRLRCKKFIHAKPRFRDSAQKLPRFRDRTKFCVDAGFSKDHWPPLYLVMPLTVEPTKPRLCQDLRFLKPLDCRRRSKVR